MYYKRMKEERKRIGGSQENFAAQAGVSRRAYASWESGDTSPTAVHLANLAVSGADIQYIVTGERSDNVLTPDERELLSLFRAASLTGKAAAVGALKGAADSAKTSVKVRASGNANAAGRDLTIGRK
jgi:transcriptional regulator with XRE-family HTH domain